MQTYISRNSIYRIVFETRSWDAQRILAMQLRTGDKSKVKFLLKTQVLQQNLEIIFLEESEINVVLPKCGSPM